MPAMDDVLRHYSFDSRDEGNRSQLAEIILPLKEQFAEDFYAWLEADPYTASFFPSQAAVNKRKRTIQDWLNWMLTASFDHRLLLRLERIGKRHVEIGLEGHYVNAAMGFIRRYFHQVLSQAVSEEQKRKSLQETLDKTLDISLDVMTSSYREAELKKVFLSKQAEYRMVQWAERSLHGLNLVLMVGLLLMAAGVTYLLGSDIVYAFTDEVEHGVIRALGSLLILWMMISLLHAQIEQLKGGKLHVRIFVDLALVAFIRKLFVASLEGEDPVLFGLYISTILVLGVLYFLIGWTESRKG